MLCLGIESTAHSFSMAVVSDKGEVLSNVTDMYRPPAGWGIEPVKAAEHHKELKGQILERALKEAKVELKDIGLIAFSQGPGLPPCLHVGQKFAVELSEKNKIPIIGVNHCIAHIEIGKLFTKSKDPVTVYVSGANTQIIAFVEGKYRIFGETMDVGIGNALDKFGREIGLGFPAGPKIEELARKGKYLELPYVVKGMDLSFSGPVTEAIRKVKSGASKESACFSIQETLFSMLTEVAERAMAHTGKTEVLLTGGVAANRRLQEMLSIMAKEREGTFYKCPREFCGDCGANIGWLGIMAYKSGLRQKPKELGIKPRERTDDVNVTWL